MKSRLIQWEFQLPTEFSRTKFKVSAASSPIQEVGVLARTCFDKNTNVTDKFSVSDNFLTCRVYTSGFAHYLCTCAISALTSSRKTIIYSQQSFPILVQYFSHVQDE